MTSSNSPDLLAEAYFFTEFRKESVPLEHFFLSLKGTKERGHNREVLDKASKSGVVKEEFVSLKGIEVSRNGMYDLLPESLFFPLSLGTSSVNTPDILDQIKANRKKEEEARLFFMPFDTEMFLFKAKLIQEELFNNRINGSVYQNILEALGLGKNLLLDSNNAHLFPYLLNSYELKEEPEILEAILAFLLDSKVKIYSSLQECTPEGSLGLGIGRLGVDTVLKGSFFLEELDWIVEITTGNLLLDQAGQSKDLDDFIIQLMDFFVIAAREIHIRWIPLNTAHDPVLDSGRLGYSTII